MSTPMPAPEQRWEYCHLFFVGATRYDPGQRGPQGFGVPVPIDMHYHVHVVYMGPDGDEVETSRLLAPLGPPEPTLPAHVRSSERLR